MGALLKIYTCIFVQFLSNFSCGKTVGMRLKASPALKGLIHYMNVMVKVVLTVSQTFRIFQVVYFISIIKIVNKISLADLIR